MTRPGRRALFRPSFGLLLASAAYLGVCALALWCASLQPRSAGAIEEHAVQIAQAAEEPWAALLSPSPPNPVE